MRPAPRYFSYLQSRYLDYTSRNLFDGLHPALREELLLALNAKLIQQVACHRWPRSLPPPPA